MAEKYFNRHQAEDLLPMIVNHLDEARRHKRRIEELEGELSRATARVLMVGGSIPPYAELAINKAEREKSQSQLIEAVRRIQETGCLVKDLDVGLVDFPTLLNDEEVYLCWKLGEERIRFWHRIDEGFAGRKPLQEIPPREDLPPGKPRVQ